MSIQAVGAVLDHSQAEKSARLVAISIANHVDKNGVGWLSVRLARQESRLKSRTTVIEAIDRLRDELGELVILVEADGRIHRPPLYWLKLPGLSGECGDDHPYFLAYGPRSEIGVDPGPENGPGPSSESEPPPDQKLDPPGSKDCTHPGTNSGGGLYREPSKSLKTPFSPPGGDDVDPVQEIYDFWKQQTSRNGSTQLTRERRRAIEARLNEGRPVAFIKQAVAGCAASPYHQGKNDLRRRYDDLTLICRNGSKLEQFAEMASGDGAREAVAPAGPIEESKAAAEAWEAAKAKLQAEMKDTIFGMFVAPLEVVGERDGHLVLVDSSGQGGGWVRRKYGSWVRNALHGFEDFEIVDETQLEYEQR